MLLDPIDECIAAAQAELPDAQDGARRTSSTVFRNPFIKRWFARAHWITPLVWFGSVMAIGIARGFSHRLGGVRMVQLFVLGLLSPQSFSGVGSPLWVWVLGTGRVRS